jgi:hypothetical protein
LHKTAHLVILMIISYFHMNSCVCICFLPEFVICNCSCNLIFTYDHCSFICCLIVHIKPAEPWAARHKNSACVPCRGPMAWPMARPGTARPGTARPGTVTREARRSVVPARHARAACRAVLARWPYIRRRHRAWLEASWPSGHRRRI